MIKFEISLAEQDIITNAKKYFVKQQYWAYVNYISDKFDLCSPQIKSQILSMLGNIYLYWMSYDKAVAACHFALIFDDSNADALLCLARAYKEIRFDFAFKDAFMSYSMLAEDKVFDDLSLIDHFNSLNQAGNEEGIALVNDKFRYERMCEIARRLLDEGDFDGAAQCYEQIIERFPDKIEIYDSLAFVYKSLFEDEKLEKLCKVRFEKFPDDIGTIALYLFVNKSKEDFDGTELYKKMLGMEILTISTLKSVCSVAEYYKDYEKCLEMIEKFANANNCIFNHELLVMRLIANLKLGRGGHAKKILTQLNIAYGLLGFGLVCKNLMLCDANELSISNINYMPDSLWRVMNEQLTLIRDKSENGDIVSQSDYWEAFELLVMCADEEDIKDFLVTYKEQFTLKNPSKIGGIIYLRNITDITKTGVLVGLLSAGVIDFSFFHYSKIQKEVYHDIALLDEYPDCYREAYHYAFAYCGLNLTDFSVPLQTSTLELLGAMSDTKRKFRDQFALAGAIICNTYLVLGDDVVGDVANMIECNAKRLKRYIGIIKKEGEFFDLNEDDMFEMFIKRISSKFIIPDSVDD